MSPFDATLLARVVATTVGALLEPVAVLGLLATVVTLGVVLVGLAVERRDLAALTTSGRRSNQRPARVRGPLQAHLGHSGA